MADGPMSTPRRPAPKSIGAPIMAMQHCRMGSGPRAIKHPWIRNRLAHVLQTADPGNASLHAHTEARVRNSTELPQIQVPLKGFGREPVLLQPLHQQVVVV